MATAAERRTATHQRILEAAGRLFRLHGIDGVGVDAVMKEAGLTHGGFYAHFPSKEALAAETTHFLLEQAASRWSEIAETQAREAALGTIVRNYLDPARVAAGRCCVLATLGNEVARREPSRLAVRETLDRMIGTLARCLPGRRREKAVAKFATMIGAVVLARIADDPELSAAILDAAAKDVLGGEARRVNAGSGAQQSGGNRASPVKPSASSPS